MVFPSPLLPGEIERINMKKGKHSQWRRVDLHIHPPASACYAEPNVTYLDILRKAEEKGLDIIAITDHNTVTGCATMAKEVEELMLLERLNRLRAQEKQRLEEYRRLGDKVLVLPGFEFTATLGFHILGIFSEKTSIRELEYILLALNIPPDKLDAGSTEVGATTDVLTAYRIIDEAKGLVIAAHANSSHGVAMRGLGFGGQTKIAYTQDPHLHVLEVTDLEKKGRRTTASFYSGSKPEYPRRMHCIQGSDTHHLNRDPNDKNALVIQQHSSLPVYGTAWDLHTFPGPCVPSPELRSPSSPRTSPSSGFDRTQSPRPVRRSPSVQTHP